MNNPSQHSHACACQSVARCQAREAGKLFLWFPVPHTLQKVTAHLKRANLAYELMQGRSGLSISCQSGQVQTIADQMAHDLTPRELKETQVLFVRGAIQPQIQDFSDMTSLQRFIRITQADELVDMLAAERVTSYFQPIVSIQNTSQIFGYESLLRGIDPQGNLLPPGPMFEMAAEAGLLPQLDRVARLSAIRQFSQHHLDSQVFINFTPTALYDPVSCLRSTVEAIDRAGIAHHQVVFEVIESANPQDLDHLKTVLRYYRDSGFQIALDDLGSGYSGLNLLHQLRPDFIKLDMELIRGVHQNPYKASITSKILEIAEKLNVRTVAEGIECIEELDWLRQHRATYAQGYLIAKPEATPIRSTPDFSALPLQLTLNAQSEFGPKHQSESERVVATVTQRIRQSLELDEILQSTADEVRQLFDVDRVVIYRFDLDWSGVVVVESLKPDSPSILGQHVMDTCFQATKAIYYQKGNSRAIEDIEKADLAPCHKELLVNLKVRANLVVPILQQDRLWGLLIAHQCRGERQWQQSEINLLNQLASQVAIAIHQSELYHQLQQANQELLRLASSDGLTQLANRRCFDNTLTLEWQRLARERKSLSLILCDVDCFKLYNDAQGHLAGDDVLRQVALTISQAVKRSTDLVARYGGEEFAIVLPNTNAAGAIAIAQKIQARIQALQLPHPTSYVDRFVTLSLGLATLIPDHSISPKTLIAAADQGLYQAKAQGRNCLAQASLPV